MKKILVDTNYFLDTFTIDKNYIYVLLSSVNRELEKHKQYGNEDLRFRSRKATRFIEDNLGSFEFDTTDYNVTFDSNLDNSYVDNKIVQACIDMGYSLLTKDILLKHKAKMYGVDVIENESNHEFIDYKGYKEYVVSDEELADAYENPHINKYDLIRNQYLILRHVNSGKSEKFKWNGHKLEHIKLPSNKKLKPLNDLQACAIDLIMDKDIPIKIIAGTYGSGKTILSVKGALYHVIDKGNYSKLMVVRNPIGTGEEIGWLKGTKEDKTAGFFKPIIQHLEGGEQEAYFLEQRGQLLKEIPYYMKGLSIEDTFLLCDEAEDLDVKIIKLIGTRIGRNSCVCFSGDYKQAEDKYMRNNGLLTAIEKLKGNPLVGIIVLDEDVRSDASKVFAELE